MHALDATLTEQLRVAAREVLATRPGIALDLPGIRRRIDQDKLVEFAYTNVELRGTMTLLLDLGQITLIHGTLGATEYFRATAAGMLAFERGQ